MRTSIPVSWEHPAVKGIKNIIFLKNKMFFRPTYPF